MADAFDQLTIPNEGIRNTVYDDATGKPIVPGSVVKGHPTIGIGFALDVSGITDDEIQYLYRNRKQAVFSALLARLPWTAAISPIRQATLACMAYQLGIGGLLEFKEALTCAQAGDYAGAAEEFMNSDWADETPVRAKQLTSIFESGVMPTT